MANPEGYRKAIRLMKLAEKFNKPIITLIDTPGAYPGLEAEERGQGEAIARNIYEMLRLKVPVICVIIGEGASGGALGIGAGDRVFMMQNTWYTVISPESCSSILWRNWDNKEKAADQLKLTGDDMLQFGLVDGVNYFVAKGDKSFWQIVKSDGYPKPRQNACQDHVGVKKYRAPKCCLVLKERPLIKLEKKLGVDLIFWGIQATESMNRRLLFLTRGEFYYNVTEKRFKVSPLMIFTDKDIFEYCKLNDLPLPSIYSKMKRNGCMFCTAFLSWEKAMESYDPKIYSGFKLVKDNFEAKNL